MRNTFGLSVRYNIRYDIERNVRDTIRYGADDFFYNNTDEKIRYKTGNKIANTIELIIVDSIMGDIMAIPPFSPQTKSYIKNQIKENL